MRHEQRLRALVSLSGCGSRYKTAIDPEADSVTFTPEAGAREPRGEIHVFDPHPLNWLFITWNTMEEPIRVDQEGNIVPALAEEARWVDATTLDLRIRSDVRFQDGTPCTAHSIRRNFEEVQRGFGYTKSGSGEGHW
jgi:ABC-type transport system substrate-binding protein